MIVARTKGGKGASTSTSKPQYGYKAMTPGQHSVFDKMLRQYVKFPDTPAGRKQSAVENKTPGAWKPGSHPKDDRVPPPGGKGGPQHDVPVPWKVPPSMKGHPPRESHYKDQVQRQFDAVNARKHNTQQVKDEYAKSRQIANKVSELEMLDARAQGKSQTASKKKVTGGKLSKSEEKRRDDLRKQVDKHTEEGDARSGKDQELARAAAKRYANAMNRDEVNNMSAAELRKEATDLGLRPGASRTEVATARTDLLMKHTAALHEPDIIGTGKDKIGTVWSKDGKVGIPAMGEFGSNSGIGSKLSSLNNHDGAGKPLSGMAKLLDDHAPSNPNSVVNLKPVFS